MQTARLTSIAALSLFAAAPSLHAACDTTGLDSTIEFSHDGVDYTLYYDTDGAYQHRITDTIAEAMQDGILDCYDRMVGSMSFRAPHQSTLPTFNWIVNDVWFSAEPDCVYLEGETSRGWPMEAVRNDILHEMFHTIQRNYMCDVVDCDTNYLGSTFGKWVAEGTGNSMMDKVFSDTDNSTGWPYYEDSAATYLTTPNKSLFDQSYDSCIWWNYLMEQLGTHHIEPEYGIDFMRAFWAKIASNGVSGEVASRTAMKQTIAAYTSRSTDDIFLDFATCNILREYDATGIPNAARYKYIDEATLTLGGTVPRTTLGSLPASGTVSGMDACTAKYFSYVVSGLKDCEVIGMTAESDETMGYALAAIDSVGKVIGLRRSLGTVFGATFVNSAARPITRIVGVVAAFEAGGGCDYAFARGTPRLTIVRPTFAHQAYPGPAATPGNFLLRVMVIGPVELEPDGIGVLSVLGLQASDFTVKVGTLNAPILSAGYVGGEYQLIIDAPVQPSDGLYPIQVSLCAGGTGEVGATQENCVFYGNITFHHSVVLDVSGSMTSPNSAKLDAAKEAAKFYIDAINDSDRFTVVTFSGDNAESNEDATNLKGAAGLVPANAANRTAFRALVNAQVSKNMTSIGDGLWTGQDALDTDDATGVINTMLLLSDGVENEPRYWRAASVSNAANEVANRVNTADTIVNTIAFGDDADTAMMQDIATSTEGDYSYIEVDVGAGAAPPAMTVPASSFTTMQNRLSLAFLGGVERARSLERLALERRNVAANSSTVIAVDLAEDKVSKGVFFVGWSSPGTQAVKVTDPSGVDVSTYATKYADDSHVVFHFGGLMRAGKWNVVFDEKAGKAQEVFAGISGQPENALSFVCSLGQYRGGGSTGQQESVQEQFEQGLPVDLVITATDRLGPARNLTMTADVIMPSGQHACAVPIPLTDRGIAPEFVSDDAIFGLRFTRTPEAASISPRAKRSEDPSVGVALPTGTYRMIITVTGKTNTGEEVTRTLEKTFQVYQRNEAQDTDQDGMPDTWEVFYGTQRTVNDAAADPDLDNLSNLDEFLRGTNPNDPDTDNGGESDGSEVALGHCPLSATDDAFPAAADAAVVSATDSHGTDEELEPNSLLLFFPDSLAYTGMEIFRSTIPGNVTNAANRIATVALNGVVRTSFLDRGLVAGTPYFYKVRALGAAGASSPFSRLLRGVPSTDPVTPHGVILQNNGDETTDSPTVLVSLFTRSNATHYRLSAARFTGAETWIPLAASTNFNFGTPAPGSRLRLFGQFRNAAGTISRTVSDDLVYTPGADTDGDGIPDATDPDDDNDGLTDVDEINFLHTDSKHQDTDGDGYTDGEEKAAGTDPLNATSVPDADGDGVSNKLESIYGSPPNNATRKPNFGLTGELLGVGQFRLRIPTKSGARYQVRCTTDLKTPRLSWQKVGAAFDGTGADSVIDLPRVESRQFYRVEIVLPPVP
ncbi:MAG: VWA domain-containing protein [Verrucomicrobia bacterium]|nr:VWA domain-containing protein [Verrucomicrobiota bacterium]